MSSKNKKSKEKIRRKKNSKMVYKNIESVRSKIDSVDNNIHRLLIERGELVEKVLHAKKLIKEKKLGLYRPDREYSILNRIVLKHHGLFPIEALVASWREFFSGYRKMQGNLNISYLKQFKTITTRHFGICANYFQCDNSNQTINFLLKGKADIAVLPFPNNKNRWWLKLIKHNAINIIGSVESNHNLRKKSKLLLLGKQKKEYSVGNTVLSLMTIQKKYYKKIKQSLIDNDFELYQSYKLDRSKMALFVGFYASTEKEITSKIDVILTENKHECNLRPIILGGFESRSI